MVHLDNDFQTLRKLIAEMLKRRDQWLRHVVGAPDPAALRILLEAALDRTIRDGVAFARAATLPEFAGFQRLHRGHSLRGHQRPAGRRRH